MNEVHLCCLSHYGSVCVAFHIIRLESIKKASESMDAWRSCCPWVPHLSVDDNVQLGRWGGEKQSYEEGVIPSLVYTPPALEQIRGPTRGSSPLSSLNSPTKEVKSLRGSEAISANSFLSALFIPDVGDNNHRFQKGRREIGTNEKRCV